MKIVFLNVLIVSSLLISSCGAEKKEEKKEVKEEKKEEKTEEPSYEYTYTVSEIDVPGGWKVSISTDGVTVDKVSEVLGKSYGIIHPFLTKGKYEMGIPFAITHEWVNENEPFQLEAAIPVTDSTIKVKAPMQIGKSYKGKALKVDYFGDYSKMAKAYEDLENYMKEKGYSNNGSTWEVYLTDPYMEKDTAKWKTEIYYPVK